MTTFTVFFKPFIDKRTDDVLDRISNFIKKHNAVRYKSFGFTFSADISVWDEIKIVAGTDINAALMNHDTCGFNTVPLDLREELLVSYQDQSRTPAANLQALLESSFLSIL